MSAASMINCRQLISFIVDYLEGALNAAENDTFERHLERCNSCLAYLASYRKTIVLTCEALEAPVDDDVPAELIQAILARTNVE